MDSNYFQPREVLYQSASALHTRPRTRNNYRHVHNIVYAEAHGVGLIMDVFRPLSRATQSGVIDVVSGGWHSGRAMLTEHIGLGLIDALCDRGMTVFAVSPGSLPLFTGFEMVNHVYAAIRHIKANADDYDIAPDRLGIAGVSAGGHLAALAALKPQEAHARPRAPWQYHGTHVKAVALFFPPTDLLDYGGIPITRFCLEGLDLTRLVFHDGMTHRSETEIAEQLAALSPARLSPKDPPPFILVQGKKDLVVPWRQAEKLAAALRRAGGEAAVLLKDEGGHLWPEIHREVEHVSRWLLENINK